MFLLSMGGTYIEMKDYYIPLINNDDGLWGM